MVSVALGSIEGGMAKLRVCEFFVNNNGGLDSPRCDTIQGTSSGSAGWTMGSNEATLAYLKTHGATMDHTEGGQLVFVRKSIGLEILADRQSGENGVGPPIVVGKFDAAGLHIVEPGACIALGRRK